MKWWNRTTGRTGGKRNNNSSSRAQYVNANNAES